MFSITKSCLIQTLPEAIWKWIISVAVSAKVKHQQIQVQRFNSGHSPLTLCRRVLSPRPERQKETDSLFSPPCSQPNSELQTDPHRQGKLIFQVLNKDLCPLLLLYSGAGNFRQSRLSSRVCNLLNHRSYAFQRPWVSFPQILVPGWQVPSHRAACTKTEVKKWRIHTLF